MAGEIYLCLKFMAERDENDSESKVPMLDISVWAGKDKERDETVYYEYYEKKVTLPLVIMKRSAISENMKRTVLSQELIRRMRNTDVRIGKEKKVKIVEKFMRKMRRSGYDEKQRKEMLRAGLLGYYRMRKGKNWG